MENVRIKHTMGESYKLYAFIPKWNCWLVHKHYSSKASALSAIKRLKGKNNNYIFKIVWSPYPFASDSECIDVYDESINKGVKNNATYC